MNSTLLTESGAPPSRQDFTTETFDRDVPSKSPSLLGHSQQMTMVIPPVQPKRFQRNLTPALIGPLRSDWWKALLTKWIPWPTKAESGNSQGDPAMSRLQASQNGS